MAEHIRTPEEQIAETFEAERRLFERQPCPVYEIPQLLCGRCGLLLEQVEWDPFSGRAPRFRCHQCRMTCEMPVSCKLLKVVEEA